jgi:hypothetical protein
VKLYTFTLRTQRTRSVRVDDHTTIRNASKALVDEWIKDAREAHGDNHAAIDREPPGDRFGN